MPALTVRVRNRKHLLDLARAGASGGNTDLSQQGGDTGAISTVGVAGSMVNGANNRFSGKQIFLGPGAHTSTVTASPATIASDGSASSTISVAVLDNFASGPVSGVTVTLAVATADAGNVTITQPAAVTNSSGVASGSIVVRTNGAHIITATADTIIIDQTATVTGQTGNTPDATKTTLVLSGSSEAVGAAVTATVQAKDSSGANIATGGATVTLSAAGGTSVVTVGSVTDNGDGTYTANISGVTAGTATTISGTINAVAISGNANPTLTVTGGGGSTGNIYTWTFQGASDAIASGALVNNSNAAFFGTKSPPWQRDTVLFYAGTQSAKCVLPVTAGNTGTEIWYRDNTNRSKIWARIVYYQPVGFNNDGVTDNSDQIKFFRIHALNFGTIIGSIFISNGKDQSAGKLGIRFDHTNDYLVSGHTYYSSQTLNSLEGAWNYIGIMFDYTSGNTGVPANDRCAAQIWLNGTLIVDKTGANAINTTETLSASLREYQLRGTINSVSGSVTQENIGQFDIGTNDLSGSP